MKPHIIQQLLAITAAAFKQPQRPDAVSDQPVVSATAPRIGGTSPNTGRHAPGPLQARTAGGVAVEGGEVSYKPTSPAADDPFASTYCHGYYCRDALRCTRHQNRKGEPAALWARQDMNTDHCEQFRESA